MTVCIQSAQNARMCPYVSNLMSSVTSSTRAYAAAHQKQVVHRRYVISKCQCQIDGCIVSDGNFMFLELLMLRPWEL